MSESSGEKLVTTYFEERDWQTRLNPVRKTSKIVRELATALTESGSIGTQELTALYRLCMNNDTYPVSSKRSEVNSLEIPADTQRSLTDQIDETVGTVGGLLFPVDVPPQKEAEVTDCIETLVQAADHETLDTAVERIAALDLPKVECGKLSPIFYYLQPEYYPVVNTMSRGGMAQYFDEDISNALVDYTETATVYRTIRDEHEFETNFRDLDFFFVWATKRELTPEKTTMPSDRAYYWVNQGNQTEITDEYLRAKVDDVWHHDLDRLEVGDIVFHNFDGELIGLSTVNSQRETDTFRGTEYQRVGVNFRWFAEPVTVNEEFKSALNEPKFRQKYSPIDSNGHLKQAYLSELSPPAVEFVLDRVEGWNLLGEVDEREETETKVPEKPAQAEEIARQLKEQKQLIFYGPPGTGKTYTAERFATWWASQQDAATPVNSRIETVTFHPSFTYEDFIEGLTAQATDNGQVAYGVQDGILKRFAETATDAYEKATAAGTDPPRFVLIIDEINRGNLAQIFGETITLLEADKRGSTQVRLAHSDTQFSLPPNLYLIGTMNTADRSIALVDAALRRRFRFISYPPDFSQIVAYHELPDNPLEEGTQFESLLWLSIVTLEEMNDRIVTATDLGKGKQIGHSRLFGVETLEELRDVWRFDILPLLEEYYFGQFDRIRRELFDNGGERLFDWDRKEIRAFTVKDLGETLATFHDGQIELSYSETTTSSTSTDSRKYWDEESFFDEITTAYESEVVAVYQEFFEFGETEADRIEYGTGKRTGSVQFYWNEYNDGNRLVYELRTNGTLQFRFWNKSTHDRSVFEQFVEQINPVLADPITTDYLYSDEFNGLEIPIKDLRNEADSEQVTIAISEFVENCASTAE